jgi:hypothetical protein
MLAESLIYKHFNYIMGVLSQAKVSRLCHRDQHEIKTKNIYIGTANFEFKRWRDVGKCKQ